MSPARKQRRSPCPVSCTLDLIGDRWTLLVIRDLFAGKTHFKDFTSSPEGIATNVLADRLALLQGAGLVARVASTERPRHPAYRLTEKGRSLLSVLQAVADWGLEHLDGTEARITLAE